MKTPTCLFKYQPFSELSIRSLKEQSIYFGPPTKFNDPYDCSLSPNVTEQSPDQLEAFRSNELKRIDIPAKAKQELEQMPQSQIAQMLKNSVKQVFGSQIENFQRTCGVSCFSESNDNLLMWSHYSGGGSGFCLEFDTSFEPFNKPMQVCYSERIPEIDPVTILGNDDFNLVLSSYTTKSKHWEYEKEWRVIHKNAGTHYTYKADSLLGIYFGTEIHPSSLEIICLIIQGQNPNVKFYKGKRSSTEYRLEFEEFQYTNYATAKQHGRVT